MVSVFFEFHVKRVAFGGIDGNGLQSLICNSSVFPTRGIEWNLLELCCRFPPVLESIYVALKPPFSAMYLGLYSRKVIRKAA
jgi:hypothetical protein